MHTIPGGHFIALTLANLFRTCSA